MLEELEAQIVEIAEELIAEDDLDVPGGLTHETRLFGKDGILDSMGLVSLVVAVEQAIEESFGIQIRLADERALSQRRSPYRSIRTLAEYAENEIKIAQK